jgi:hypothetical protein
LLRPLAIPLPGLLAIESRAAFGELFAGTAFAKN